MGLFDHLPEYNGKHNTEIMTRLLETRRKPLYEFKAWDRYKRDLAKVAMDNINNPDVSVLMLDWVSRGDNAPQFGHKLFDALYPLEFELSKHYKTDNGFLYFQEYENVGMMIVFHRCIIKITPADILPAWSYVERIETDIGTGDTRRFYDKNGNLLARYCK